MKAAPIDEVGTKLFQRVLDVAGGRKRTWAEQWKLQDALMRFNPAPVTWTLNSNDREGPR